MQQQLRQSLCHKELGNSKQEIQDGRKTSAHVIWILFYSCNNNSSCFHSSFLLQYCFGVTVVLTIHLAQWQSQKAALRWFLRYHGPTGVSNYERNTINESIVVSSNVSSIIFELICPITGDESALDPRGQFLKRARW